ncbi:MAG TPA: ABC transporter permease [Verrucomicrobiae bacterium]|nr:ABC transporter permease [Verrucomicrobiae bacterium]
MKRVSLPLWLVSAFLYVFMYAPLAVVIIFSFNAAKHGGPWTGFTTDWYTSLLADKQKQDATWNTLILGAASTVIATALGTMLGYGLSRYWFPGKKMFSLAMYIPVMIPDIVMAVAMLAFFKLLTSAGGFLQMGLATMTIAHITFQIPFVAIVVRSRLVGMDPAIEEAAHDLGASTWQTFWSVTFPLMLPGVLAGAMLAFTLSLDDFVVSFFTTGPGATTLPILIYSSVKRGITPDINALSTLIVLASVIGTIGVTLLQRPRQPSGG